MFQKEFLGTGFNISSHQKKLKSKRINGATWNCPCPHLHHGQVTRNQKNNNNKTTTIFPVFLFFFNSKFHFKESEREKWKWKSVIRAFDRHRHRHYDSFFSTHFLPKWAAPSKVGVATFESSVILIPAFGVSFFSVKKKNFSGHGNFIEIRPGIHFFFCFFLQQYKTIKVWISISFHDEPRIISIRWLVAKNFQRFFFLHFLRRPLPAVSLSFPLHRARVIFTFCLVFLFLSSSLICYSRRLSTLVGECYLFLTRLFDGWRPSLAWLTHWSHWKTSVSLFFFKVEPCSCISIQMCLYRLFVCLFFQFLCVFFVILFRFPPPVSDRWNDENYLASEAKKVQTTKWRPSFPSSRYFKKDITISDPYGVYMENSVIGPYLMSSWKKKSFEKK